jgi:hypothetical protein
MMTAAAPMASHGIWRFLFSGLLPPPFLREDDDFPAARTALADLALVLGIARCALST